MLTLPRKQGVRGRLGKSWSSHFTPTITRLYFMARATNYVPKYAHPVLRVRACIGGSPSDPSAPCV
jgi:hypothetical protein